MSHDNNSVISLQELQSGIKDTINSSFSSYLWIHAELSEVNINRNGHCYVELVEKQNEEVVARIRGTIWAFTFRMLKPYFESSTGFEFTSGIKVSLKIVVEFHEVYGLSLNIKDIDPSYTIGDIELQRRKIINQLEDEGVLDMNSELELPLLIQNIAVISSSTAAGYGDWKNQIKENKQGYHFNYELFEAKMQGVDTGSSVIAALDQIYQKEQKFDLVVIIRGGGSKMDLAGFDDYDLAANIAQFPLPIITGIGHERDESIADIVAHTALKTPTAVADFLIEQMQSLETQLDRISSEIVGTAQQILENHSHDIEMGVQKLHQISKYNLQKNRDILYRSTKQLLRETQNTSAFAEEKLNQFLGKVSYESKRILRRKSENIESKKSQLKEQAYKTIHVSINQISQIEKLNRAFDPMRVLDRGFAMIEQNNKIITSTQAIQKNKKLKIIMKDGKLEL